MNSSLNNRKRQKTAKLQNLKLKLFTAIIAVPITMGASLAAPSQVQADQYDQKINQLNQQNALSAQKQQRLEQQAGSLAEAIADLRAQISQLEAQIRQNEAKRNELNRKIVAAKKEIAEQKAILQVNLKEMYLANDMSTIEMLASSNDLSEYVDRQQYRQEVNGKVKATMERIDTLQKKLESQKTAVDKLLKDQHAMQGQLNAQRAETNRLLSLNRQQQLAYDQDIRNNQGRIAALRRQQAAENARHNVSAASYSQSYGGRSYPWAHVRYPSSSVDPWGMYKRECVSYTAWKVAQSGRHMPYWGGRGNAKNWDDNARAAGIPVDYTPRVGDVAVSNAGIYGHVMYVEAVHGDGTISISQYNAGWDGRYSEARRTTAGLVFIHFR
jgi:surface antigen